MLCLSTKGNMPVKPCHLFNQNISKTQFSYDNYTLNFWMSCKRLRMKLLPAAVGGWEQYLGSFVLV